MKKQIMFFTFILFNCLFAWGQGRYIKTSTPCNDELLKKTPGRWMPISRGFYAKISKPQEQEIVNRLNSIHQLVFNIYPEPSAFDAVTFFSSTDQVFASQLKIENSQDRSEDTLINGTPSVCYGYSVKFCGYFCGRTAYEMVRGAGCESGTNIVITTNSLEPLLISLKLEGYHAGIMRVDGRPIKKMIVSREKKWKGYDLYAPETGSGINMVLLLHEGVLPYIPVTRKQYLDRCFEYFPKFFDKDIKPYEQREGLALLMKKEEWEEQMKKQRKIRDDVIKHYQDELNATTKAGLLNTPAILFGDIMDISTTYPIFTTQAAGGNMLVTENPVYFKKDLPKYIPQLMIYSWWDCQCGVDQSLNPYKLYDENFPIEKLQAMIDK